MEWFLKVVRDNYVNFSGRARRKEYWMFILFYFLIAIVAAIIDYFLQSSTGTIFSPVGSLLGLALFLPSLGVLVRRLHDMGRSGWWALVGLIPIVNFIGIFVLLYWLVQDSQVGENQWGPDPKVGEPGH